MKDYFLYSGRIDREHYLVFAELVEKATSSQGVALVLSTNGGDPDAAYKIGRCLQFRYKENVSIFVPGICKSAGTLLAIAASELVFSPHGELGPLDVQMVKQDGTHGRESGLDIEEGLAEIESRAKNLFHNVMRETLQGHGGAVTKAQIASDSAAKFVSSLLAPVLSRIDPKEIGERKRAMKIAEEYGYRLNEQFKNLSEDFPGECEKYVLDFLLRKCPHHGFVIDAEEAGAFFNNSRFANELEEEIIKEYRSPSEGEPIVKNITDKFQTIKDEKAKGGRQNSKKKKKKKKKKA